MFPLPPVNDRACLDGCTAEPIRSRSLRCDLLAILRALWLATDPIHVARRRRIEAIANDIQGAYASAKRLNPGTLGYAAAWAMAEKAVEEMGGLVDTLMPLEPVVTAARERVTGREGRPRQKPLDPRR